MSHPQQRARGGLLFAGLSILWLASAVLAVGEKVILRGSGVSLWLTTVFSLLGLMGCLYFAGGFQRIGKSLNTVAAIGYLAVYLWRLATLSPSIDFGTALATNWRTWSHFLGNGDYWLGLSALFDHWLMPLVLITLLVWWLRTRIVERR